MQDSVVVFFALKEELAFGRESAREIKSTAPF